MLKAESKKNAYFFDYRAKAAGQPEVWCTVDRFKACRYVLRETSQYILVSFFHVPFPDALSYHL
jgi:hypothetical protein